MSAFTAWAEKNQLSHPASHCPHCQKPILWQDNIPLLSYILLRGKCRFCGKKISFRYFSVELLTGLLFLALYHRFGATPVTLIYCLLTAGLIVATFVDIDFQIIPDEISIGGIVLGIILSVLFPAIHGRLKSSVRIKRCPFGHSGGRRRALDFRLYRRFYF